MTSTKLWQRLVPSFKLSTIGSQAFPIAAAKIWNALPNNVVSASSIETHSGTSWKLLCSSNLSVVSTWPDLAV